MDRMTRTDQLTRRTALRRAVAGLGACSGLVGRKWAGQQATYAEDVDRRSAAGVATEPMSLGFSLYGVRSLPLGKALEVVARTGYDAVELAVMPDWPADPKLLPVAARRELATQLADLGLSLAALMEDLSLDIDESAFVGQLERLRAAAGLAHDLSPAAPPPIETVLGGKAGHWDAVRGLFADRLAIWADLAREHDVTIAVKPHRFGALDSPAEAAALMKSLKSDRLGLVYDYSHFSHRNLTVRDTVVELARWIRFVHVKDAVVEAGRVRFVLPGEGDTVYEDLLTRLAEAGYAGCVCVEVSGMVHGQPGYDPELAARQSYEHLALAVQRAKIPRRSKP